MSELVELTTGRECRWRPFSLFRSLARTLPPNLDHITSQHSGTGCEYQHCQSSSVPLWALRRLNLFHHPGSFYQVFTSRTAEPTVILALFKGTTSSNISTGKFRCQAEVSSSLKTTIADSLCWCWVNYKTKPRGCQLRGSFNSGFVQAYEMYAVSSNGSVFPPRL
jgi:hypothetical protein